MQKDIIVAGSIAMSLLVSACGGGSGVKPTPDTANADYGPQISQSRYESFVRGSQGFFDPESARISCDTPKKGWRGIKGWGDSITEYRYGWIANCRYNAKNRMGGYVGEKQGTFMINKDRFADITDTLYKGYAE